MKKVKFKTASEIFHPVDPDLKVVDGGRRRIPRKVAEAAWKDAGGAICPRCRQEAVRFRVRDGVCSECAKLLNKEEEDTKERKVKLKRQIEVHNKRIDKKRRAA